jgi:hypothetical protein
MRQLEIEMEIVRMGKRRPDLSIRASEMLYTLGILLFRPVRQRFQPEAVQ